MSKSDSSVDPCWYQPVQFSALTASLFTGHDRAQGVLYRVSCPDSLNVRTQAPVYTVMGYSWAATGKAPIAPPPDPAVLARQAYGELPIPNPTIHLGPDSDRLAVKLWTWLWVDNPGGLSKTVTARGLSVTATATLASTTWSMGEPTDPTTNPTPVSAFTCSAGGTPPTPGSDWKTQPPCGYRYHWKSTTARTNGAGTWPIVATATWQVTWTATNGTAGTLNPPLQTSTTTAARIGEYRTILVEGTHR